MASILVVEDDALVSRLIATILGIEGHEVFQAFTAREALDVCRGGAIDLVIMDMVLPDSSGFEAWQSISSLHPESVVLFTSGTPIECFGSSSSPLMRENISWLAKPFHPDDLRAAVARALRPPEGRAAVNAHGTS